MAAGSQRRQWLPNEWFRGWMEERRKEERRRKEREDDGREGGRGRGRETQKWVTDEDEGMINVGYWEIDRGTEIQRQRQRDRDKGTETKGQKQRDRDKGTETKRQR